MRGFLLMAHDHDSLLQKFTSSRKQQLNRLADKNELDLLVLAEGGADKT